MNTHATIIKLLSKKAMSLAALREATNLSMPTLRRAIDELSNARWIRAVGQSSATGGRPAKLFGLDDRTYLIIGVHIQLPGMRLITTNLQSDIIDEYVVPNNRQLLPNDVIREIADYAEYVRQTFSGNRILGIGVAAPGYLDPVSGDIISIERVSGWQNFPLRTRLEANLGLPTVIENDIDCMALDSIERLKTKSEGSLIYIGFDEGVKASLILNGEFYKGPFGNAGTIGWHLLRPPDQATSNYRELVTSIHGIVQFFKEQLSALDEEDKAEYAAILTMPNVRQQFQRILEAAQEGLPLCQSIVETMLSALTIAAANLIYTLQPSMLIIGGALGSMPRRLFDHLEDQIRQHLPPLVSNSLIIQQAQLTSPNSVSVGGTHRFLQHYIEDERNHLI